MFKIGDPPINYSSISEVPLYGEALKTWNKIVSEGLGETSILIASEYLEGRVLNLQAFCGFIWDILPELLNEHKTRLERPILASNGEYGYSPKTT